MATHLSLLISHDIVPNWKWKTSPANGNKLISPSQMETRHLFNTLRMIWNHTMPSDARIHPYKEYDFSSYYTPSYLKIAILKIGVELLNRKDIRPQWAKELDIMINYINSRFDLLEISKV
jgi:hypothetical protein